MHNQNLKCFQANLDWNQLTSTGKFLSEALIFASTNPQYDYRLLIVHEKCKLRIPAEHFLYTNWFFFGFF